MAENKYFANALSNFMHDFASGGAIRHLADQGYTVNEIHDMLDYPTPIERVQDTVWKHYLEKGVISLDDPAESSTLEKVRYVRDRDQYGHESFRKVTEITARPVTEYIKCDFGKRIYQNKEKLFAMLEEMDEKDKEYILGLPWPLRPVYHIADERMRRIQNYLNTRQNY